MSLNSKGTVQHLTGRYQEAHATLIEALQHARAAAQPSLEATVLSCLGDLYADGQQWERARVMYEDARQVGGNAQLNADLEISTLTLLVRQHKSKEAARTLRQLSGITRSTRDTAVHYLTASIACQQGEYEQAAAKYHSLASLVAENDSLPDKLRTCLLQAQLMIMAGQGQSRNVVEPLDTALRLTRQIGHPAFLAVEMLHLRHLLHRALALGWAPAHDLLQLQQDILNQAQMLAHDDQRPMITVRALGADQIFLNGKPVDLGWQKAREVFFYLLAHQTGATIDTLREEIWPDLSVERSKEALRSAIYQLRSVLPRDLIVLQNRQTYLIDSNVAHIDYDVQRFLSLSNGHEDNINELFEFAHLYRGQYLPFTSNQWSMPCRTMCEQRYLQVLHTMARHSEQVGNYGDALEFYRRILATNIFEEAAHAGVMRCQIELGNRAAAIQQYQQLRELLDSELGINLDGESEVELLYSRILAS